MTWADEIEQWKKKQQVKDESQKVSDWRKKFAETKSKTEWDKVYTAYLNSDIWKQIRKRILKRAKNRCENKKCGVSVVDDSFLQVHHDVYDRVGGLERDADLRALCASCHLEADEKREERVEAERGDRQYRQWFDNWGANKYKEDWEIVKYDRESEIEEEFQEHAYQKWCKDNRKSYNPDIKVPEEFIEMLEQGQYDEYEEFSGSVYSDW